jgi:uncharacterized protein (TIGR02266 family)
MSLPKEAIVSEDEKRQERIVLRAQVSIKSQTNFFMGFSEDISEGGVFISTECAPNIGEEIEVNVPTLSGGEEVVVGIVRWHRAQGDGTITGCGVQFQNLSSGARKAIQEMIATLKKEPLFFEL